ncbi:MAG: transketolase [Bacteroidales bacterium]|jgi:transketolase|nr:transketolase [Bacteroidales bacterium]MBR5664414.1 transketolase [Bacteroidales bacterium]MCR5190251.1 transketolase [Bacteroidales bacterium]
MLHLERVTELEKKAMQTRRDILRMVHTAQSGHPGGSLGCADFLTALFSEVMDRKPDTFRADGHGQDMFFLSNGHITPALYSCLARAGYFDIHELGSFRQLGSRLQGHPSIHSGLPGIHVASGSLGQGTSVAIGAAEAKKLNHDPSLVYVLTGDGELQEGQNWEAFMYAGAKQVDNLIVTVDYNKKQIDGSTDDVMNLLDLDAKFNAFGFTVFEGNGNSMPELLTILELAKEACGKGHPVAFLMHTEMGYGVDFMTGNHKWHGTPPNDEQLAAGLAQLEETLGDY